MLQQRFWLRGTASFPWRMSGAVLCHLSLQESKLFLKVNNTILKFSYFTLFFHSCGSFDRGFLQGALEFLVMRFRPRGLALSMQLEKVAQVIS